MAEPNGELLRRVDDLVRQSGAVEAEIRADREARELEAKYFERRMTTNRRTAKIALGVGAIGVLVGIAGVVYGRSAQATANDIRAARASSIVQSCNTDNARLDSQRAQFGDVSAAIKAGAAAVFVTPPGSTAEQMARTQAALDAYNASVDGAIAAAVAKVPAENSGVSCKLLGR